MAVLGQHCDEITWDTEPGLGQEFLGKTHQHARTCDLALYRTVTTLVQESGCACTGSGHWSSPGATLMDDRRSE